MRRGPTFHCGSHQGPPEEEKRAGASLSGHALTTRRRQNKIGPTVDFLDVEGILVEFVLEDQLLQIVEGLLVKSLPD